jgi:hypothetical protein
MTCINNIIAASSVSGVRRQEGYIMEDSNPNVCLWNYRSTDWTTFIKL